MTPAPLTLRPDQRRALVELYRLLSAGVRRVLVQAPTGWGKGTVAAELLRRVERQGKRGLFTSHLQDINRDIAARCRAYGCQRVGVLMGSEPEGDANPAIVVATTQTLFARPDAMPPADFVVDDECHRHRSNTHEAVAAAYPNAIHVGFSATPARGDGAPLTFYQAIIAGPHPLELVALGCLAPVVVFGPAEPTKDLAQDPVALWPTNADGRARPGILFASSLEHSKLCAMGLVARGIRAAHVDGTTRRREELIRDFNAGALDVLCCFRLFVEGVDIPRAEVVMLACAFGPPGAMLQAVGRGRRVCAGKTRCIVYDLRGNCCPTMHGHPDRPRTYHLDGEPIRLVEGLPPASLCARCFAWGIPGRPCDVCGAVVPPPPLPRVRAVDLIEQRCARDDDAKRAEVLCRYVAEAVAKGHKPWSAAFRYRGVYGSAPARHEMEVAIRAAKGAT